jgi:hypothetical protein
MKKELILDFAKKILSDNFPKTIINFVPDYAIKPFCAQTIAKDTYFLIQLSKKKFLYEMNSIEVKALLLHELGHVATHGKCDSEDEYLAHKWAMKIARKNKLKKVYEELQKLLDEWLELKWNEDKGAYRSHIRASRKLKKIY